jgi:hypothetical protein
MLRRFAWGELVWLGKRPARDRTPERPSMTHADIIHLETSAEDVRGLTGYFAATIATSRIGYCE